MTWYKERSSQLRDFVQFSRTIIASGDIDPQFPILRSIYLDSSLDRNKALWFTALYLVFYHLGSALEAWSRYPEPTIIKKKDWVSNLSYSKQRRCFRGNDGGRRQLNALVKASDGDIERWVENLVAGGDEEGWARVRAGATALPYHGPWSSYKFCDMIKFVHGYPITAPDIGTKPGDTAGPIAGLVSLTGLSREQCSEDTKLYQDLLTIMQDGGANVDGLDQLESCLCDWQSLINGKYYIFHDIDRDLGQLQFLSSDKNDKYANQLLYIRSNIFDKRSLGELNDWDNIRLELNSVYRNRRRLVNNFEDVRVVAMRGEMR